MNAISMIREWVKQIFNADPVISDREQALTNEFSHQYEDAVNINFTAIFAGKLSSLTTTESTVNVTGDTTRAELLNRAIQDVWTKAGKWTSMAFGTGGVLLVPYVTGNCLYTDIVPQNRMIINRVNGEELRSVTIVADSTLQRGRKYYRLTDYTLDDSGQLTITQKAVTDGGTPVSLSSLAEWANIQETITIGGVEHLPLAYLKSPVDNRRIDALYGVPVTFGCEHIIREITECLEQVRQEYDLKRPMVGMDSTLFEVKNGRRILPRTGLFMPTAPGGTMSGLWEVYDPAIRDSSYYNRLQQLYELLEKQVGTSRGILTAPESRGATATEIKASLYDTYAIIVLMRSRIETALRQLLDGMNVYANAWNLAPMGETELVFDWSYSLIESSQETFNQLVTAAQTGAVEPAEVRQFIYPAETLDESRERVNEIKEAAADSASILLDEAIKREREA